MHTFISIIIAVVSGLRTKGRAGSSLQRSKILHVSVSSLPGWRIFIIFVFLGNLYFLIQHWHVTTTSSGISFAAHSASSKIPMPHDHYYDIENVETNHGAALPHMQSSI
jgi:hypothetical protein